jgi:hypothetical protein
MKVIAVSGLAPGRSRDELAAVREAGVQAIWKLMIDGIVRAAYHRREAVGVVLELEVPDGPTALRTLATLPAIRAGVLELKEVLVCDPFTALETLFTQPETEGE